MGFPTAWQKLLEDEGLFSDDADDSGGATKYGITEVVAREHGYNGPMRDLSLPLAMDIAKKAYWNVMRLDTISAIDEDLAGELMNWGFNCGTGRISEYVQRVLNVMNRKGALYSDITVDGSIGPQTLVALEAFVDHRGAEGILVLRASVMSLVGSHYITLAERREKDETFVYGWIKKRILGF